MRIESLIHWVIESLVPEVNGTMTQWLNDSIVCELWLLNG